MNEEKKGNLEQENSPEREKPTGSIYSIIGDRIREKRKLIEEYFQKGDKKNAEDLENEIWRTQYHYLVSRHLAVRDVKQKYQQLEGYLSEGETKDAEAVKKEIATLEKEISDIESVPELLERIHEDALKEGENWEPRRLEAIEDEKNNVERARKEIEFLEGNLEKLRGITLPESKKTIEKAENDMAEYLSFDHEAEKRRLQAEFDALVNERIDLIVSSEIEKLNERQRAKAVKRGFTTWKNGDNANALERMEKIKSEAHDFERLGLLNLFVFGDNKKIEEVMHDLYWKLRESGGKGGWRGNEDDKKQDEINKYESVKDRKISEMKSVLTSAKLKHESLLGYQKSLIDTQIPNAKKELADHERSLADLQSGKKGPPVELLIHKAGFEAVFAFLPFIR